MKKTLILISLLMSVNAFALICESENNPAEKLKLTVESTNLVVGELLNQTTKNLFVGKVEIDFFSGDSYKLYDQTGQEFSFFVKKELVINHCRARVCPNPGPIGPNLGKLSSEGHDDEYFKCF